MNFLQDFKERNRGIVELTVILILIVGYAVYGFIDFINEPRFIAGFISILLVSTAVVLALYKKQILLAALITFFAAGYSNAIASFVISIFTNGFTDGYEIVRSAVSALAAAYLIILILAYVFTQKVRIIKQLDHQMVLLLILSFGFLYFATISFQTALVMMLPVFIAVLLNNLLAASLLLITTTISYPFSLINHIVNGTSSSLGFYLWTITILGILLCLVQVYRLVVVYQHSSLIEEE